MNKDKQTQEASYTMMHLVGEVCWLFANSSLHHEWTYRTLFPVVLPALKAKQARVYRDHNGRPVGYVGWAFLSSDAEKRYLADPLSLGAEDWTSGKRGWLMDFVAPFGHGKLILRDLKSNLFAGHVGRYLRVRPDTDEAKIVYVHGKGALKATKDPLMQPPVVMPDNAVPIDVHDAAKRT